MPRVTYEELERAFDEVISIISEMPCGLEDMGGEYAAEISERLYQQRYEDRNAKKKR